MDGEAPRADLHGLTAIVPALNAEGVIGGAVARLRDAGVGRIVVVDGDSRDATAARAELAGARVVVAPRGRGPQLAAGAAAAGDGWLLFLHADTRLADGWAAEAARFIEDPDHGAMAAVFRFALDDDATAARRLERLVAWRTRWLALPYGDQGLLIHSDLYRALGGFRPIPIMEDVDLIRRLGRHRLRRLDSAAVTSAARYRRGYARRMARNLLCLALYFAGVPPRVIRKIYG